MTQTPTPPPGRLYAESHLPFAITARRRSADARAVARTPALAPPSLRSGSGNFYEFQIAWNGIHFQVELLRLTVGFFGRVRREFAGVTDGPFDTQEDAEAALTRRWDDYWRTTDPSRGVE